MDFFVWLREMEDLENEEIRFGGGKENPQLAAVRRSVERLLPGLKNLRVRRSGAMGDSRPRLTLEKEGVSEPLLLDALSEGERNLVAMVADIARRLELFYEGEDDPLSQPVTLLVDEIEQHLHPGWQRTLIQRLREVFPGAQIIASTQSAVVVSELEPRCLRLIEDFEIKPSAGHRAGLDVNAVLERSFGTTPRRAREQILLELLDDAIDAEKLDEAQKHLEKLEETLGPNDEAVVFHRTVLARLREG